MKKNFLPLLIFIFLLSFFIFLPSRSLILNASVSENSLSTWVSDTTAAASGLLGASGLAVSDVFYADDNSSDFDEDFNFWEWLITPLSFTPDVNSGKPLPEQIYDYCVLNDIDIGNYIDTNSLNLINYVSSYCPYSVYTVFHKSDLIRFFRPSDSNVAQWFTNFDIDSLSSDYFYYMSGNTTYYRLAGDNWGNHHLNIIRFPIDYIDTYSFYCFDDNVSSSLFDNDFIINQYNNVSNQPTFSFFSASQNGISNQVLSTGTFYSSGGFSDFSSSAGYTRTFGVLPLYYYNDYATSCLNGGFFIVPDNVPRFSFLMFHSYNDYFSFINGGSYVYEFSTDIDLSGLQIDYDELYNIISGSINGATGNLAEIINNVVNANLEEQIEILHDINNALNDSFGVSWLRKIYGLLDNRLPSDLRSLLVNINNSINNISGGGGSSGSSPDYTNSLNTINGQLTNIQGYLLFLSAEELLDDIRNDPDFSADLGDVSLLMQTKFPFCIPTDLVTILALFDAEPVEPEFYVPIPLTDNEKFLIDFSFYEQIRPVVESFLVISFIIMLSVLSAKIIKVIRGG